MIRLAGCVVALSLIVNWFPTARADDARDWKQYNYDNAGRRFNQAEDRLNSGSVSEFAKFGP